MYSRRTIRTAGAALPYSERIPTTVAPLSVTTTAPRIEERSVALPPDYTGMAFSGTGSRSTLQNQEDFPETIIPPVEEDAVLSPASPSETAIEEHFEDPLPEIADLPFASESEVQTPAEMAEAPDPVSEPEPASMGDPAEAEPPSAAVLQTPILTAEFLRSLTLEDLLLFWMLLMLMVSSQEDQIYLLLGLLLFHR
jgi:hypothetical protein